MARQYSVAVRNAWLAAYEATIGAAPKLRLYDGSIPADCATAADGTLIWESDCPSDWMGTPSGGFVAKLGTWQDDAVADGTVQYYRMYDSTGTICHEQGTAGTSGTDIIVSNASVVTGQSLTVNTWGMTAPGA